MSWNPIFRFLVKSLPGLTAYFPGLAAISLTAARSKALMASEFFIKCLLDQVNVEQLVPNQLAFLMKSKKPHTLGGLSSLLWKKFFRYFLVRGRKKQIPDF